MHAHRLFLFASLALFAAGCGTAKPFTSSTSTSGQNPDQNSAVVSTQSFRFLQINGLPDYSSSTEMRLIRLDDRANGQLYDPTQKRVVAFYGSSLAKNSFDFPLYTAIGDKLGDFHATETTPGVFVAHYEDVNGVTSPITIRDLEPNPSLEIVRVHKLTPPVGEKPSICEFSVAYPQLTPASGVEEGLRTRINQEIATASLPHPMSEADTTSTARTLNEIADAYLTDCEQTHADLRDMFINDASSSDTSEQDPNYDPEPGPWYYDQSFDVTLFDENLLSITTLSDEYAGGAHGSHFFSFLNLDLTSGKRLVMGDLIEPAKLKPFFQMERGELLKTDEEYQSLFEEDSAAFKKFIANKSPATRDELQEFSTFDSYYLTRDALVTLYNEYEISPYAAGPQSAELPFTMFRSMLKADAPITRLMQ